MHHIDLVDLPDRRYIHSDRLPVIGKQLEQWLTYLTESDHHNLIFALHDLGASSEKPAVLWTTSLRGIA
jgi:hypothetical protein